MALKVFLKKILNKLGILDKSRALLKKARLRVRLIYRYFQYKIIFNKKGYLKYFDRMYSDKLADMYIYGAHANRYIGFRKIFEELLDKKRGNFTIVETGCCRGSGWSDGNSSILFFEFLSIFGGKLISIDISRENMNICQESLKTTVPGTKKAKFFPQVANSVEALKNINEEVDLLYLDSFDFDINNPEPSMRHHIEELKSAKDIICKSKDLLLVVDDNFKEIGLGKGKYVFEWAKNTGQEILQDGYQIVIKVNNNDAEVL